MYWTWRSERNGGAASRNDGADLSPASVAGTPSVLSFDVGMACYLQMAGWRVLVLVLVRAAHLVSVLDSTIRARIFLWSGGTGPSQATIGLAFVRPSPAMTRARRYAIYLWLEPRAEPWRASAHVR